MVSKLSFSAALSTAIAGSVLLASIASASPCPFKNGLNPTDSATPIEPSSLTDNQLNSNKPDFNKLGIVGAGFAALFGLYAGSTVLKARLTKRQAPVAEMPQSEAEMYAEKSAELPTFPIIVPAEALTSVSEDEESVESESTVAR
jgi:hypothetical protein